MKMEMNTFWNNSHEHLMDCLHDSTIYELTSYELTFHDLWKEFRTNSS